MSDEISTMLKQAKSEARLENFFKFLGKNSKVLIYGAIVFLLISILVLAFNIYQNNAKEKYSAILHQSLIYQQLGENDKAKAELEKIVNSSVPSGVKSLASLRYAAFLLEQKDFKGAKKIYSNIRNCRFCDDYVRDLSSLLLVRTIISDKEELSNRENLMAKILKIEKEAKILKNYISEQIAMLELVENNPKKAYAIFEKISQDKASSDALKNRAIDGMKIAVSQGF